MFSNIKPKIVITLLSSMLLVPVTWAAPLHDAAKKGDLAEVKRLLKSGADIHAKTKSGSTPLITAGHIPKDKYKSRLDVVAYLLSKGANVNDKGWDDMSLLHMAASSYASPELVKRYIKILLKYKINVNVRDKGGNTPLTSALSSGNMTAVKLLIKHGARVNLHNKFDTPIFMSAVTSSIASKRVEMVEYMIKHGADVNAAIPMNSKNSSTRGWTVLHKAAYEGYVDVVKLLLKHGADPKRKTRDGDTALSITKRAYNALNDEKKKARAEVAKILKAHK